VRVLFWLFGIRESEVERLRKERSVLIIDKNTLEEKLYNIYTHTSLLFQ